MDAKKPLTVTSMTLLGRVQSVDDAGAWGEFVERYAPQIFSWCRRHSLQESDASDVTQEVLTKLVTAMRTFRYDPAKGRFRGWLKTITMNVVRDMARHRSHAASPADAQVLELLEDEQASTALTESIESAWQQEVLGVAMESVRLRVKRHTWDAYEMTARQEVPAAEAAEKLGIPVSDVYVAKSRVIKMLRTEVARLES